MGSNVDSMTLVEARIQEVLHLLAVMRISFAQCDYSGLVPQFSLIMGPCAGGAVYSPAHRFYHHGSKDFVYVHNWT